ncbi:MAG: hypothetical protein P4L91_01550 [Burkholderiaceae bacterium]|nr:hypothetical protein [Burkholderiaceae bacterium]
MSKNEPISTDHHLKAVSNPVDAGDGPTAKKFPYSPMSGGLRRIGPARGSRSAAGGWRASTQRFSTVYQSDFMDDHYASSEQAHSAARAFHAALQERLPKPYSNTEGGLPGAVRKTSGHRVDWIVYLNIDKKIYQKRFSTKKYGEEVAEKLARETLDAWRKTHGLDQVCTLPSREEIAQLLQTIRERFQCTLSVPNIDPISREMLQRMHAIADRAGLEFLSAVWEGSAGKYTLRCKKGHEFTRWGMSILKNPNVCKECLEEERLEQIRKIAQAKGGRCLEPSYLGYVPHRFVCAHGHEWKTNPSKIINSGTWCPRCGAIATGRQLTKKDGPERLQRIVAEKGGKCFVDTYTNSSTRCRIQCAVGHEWEAKASTVFRGVWCRVCANKQLHASHMEQSAKRFHQVVKEKGGICLEEYTGGNKRYRFICGNGHAWAGIGTYVTNGRWCRQCGDEEKRRRISDALRQYARDRGGVLLSEYVNMKTKVHWECDRGHRWYSTPNSNLRQKAWCPECAHMNQISRRKSTARLRYQASVLHSGETTYAESDGMLQEG